MWCLNYGASVTDGCPEAGILHTVGRRVSIFLQDTPMQFDQVARPPSPLRLAHLAQSRKEGEGEFGLMQQHPAARGHCGGSFPHVINPAPETPSVGHIEAITPAPPAAPAALCPLPDPHAPSAFLLVMPPRPCPGGGGCSDTIVKRRSCPVAFIAFRTTASPLQWDTEQQLRRFTTCFLVIMIFI